MAEPEDEVCGRILLDVLDQNVNSEKIVNWLQSNDQNALFKNCSRSAFIRWYMLWIRDQCEPLFAPAVLNTNPATAQPADPRQNSTYDNNFPSLSAPEKIQGNVKQNRRIHPVLVTPSTNANNIQNTQPDNAQQSNNVVVNNNNIALIDNKNQRITSPNGSEQHNVWAINKQHTSIGNKKSINTNTTASNNSNKAKFELNNLPEVHRAQNSYKHKTKTRAKPQHIAPNNTNNTNDNNVVSGGPQMLSDAKSSTKPSTNTAPSGSDMNSLRGSQEINMEMSSLSLAMAEKFLNIIQCKKEVDALSNILAAIFNGNLSQNLAHDLEFLMRLFSLKINWDDNPTKSSTEVGTNNSWKKFEEMLKQVDILRSNNNAIYFACKVVTQSLSVVKNFGNVNLHLLTSNPILHAIGFEFVEQLNDIKHQNVLHVPSTDASKPDPDFSIPLRLESETTKNMLKTNAERNVFNNREKCRDNFPKLLQELMSDPDYKNNVQSKMKDFLKQLLPQNYPFFASLFQAELLKHVLNADEFDKQLAELTDPTKLRKLNQRMTERRADNSQNYSAKQKNNNGGGNANFNNSTRPFPQQYRHKGVMYYNANTPNTNTKGQFKIRPDKETMEKDPFEGLFVDKEEKFFQMLYSINNYCLNMNIISQMRSKILELSNFQNTEQVEERFAERILKLKVLSKFLSFLIHWPTIMSYDLDSTTLMPMDDALKSANRTDSSFDILLCLKQAQATSSLTLNLPWIIEHVKIMKLDKLTSETEHFKRIVNTLKFVYISSPLVPRNDSFNINSLFILNELEKCFEYLQTDPTEIDWNLIANNNGDKSTSPFKNFIYSPVKKQSNVDARSDLLNQTFIYLCFPYLDEFSSLLKEFNSQFFSTTPRQPQIRSSFATSKIPMVKKITPVRPQNVKKSEQLLHHWFFWQHPTLSSLSDVVSKRVLSYYQSEILDLTPTLLDGFDVSTLSTPTKSLIIESDGRLEQLVSKVIQSGCQNVKPQIPAKINDAMRSLADYNTDARVLEAAIKLTIEHVTLTLPEFIIVSVRSRIKKLIEEKVSKKQKSPAKLVAQPTVKRTVPGGTTSPIIPVDTNHPNVTSVTSPTKFSGEIQKENLKENGFGFNVENNNENMTEEEKEEEITRQLNKIKLKKANKMNNNLNGLITKLGDISEKYLTTFKHYDCGSNTELLAEEDLNTLLHSFFNEVHATCLIWASRVLQIHVTDIDQRDPLFSSLKNVEALTIAFEQWMEIGFYALSLCPEELTVQTIGKYQYNMNQIRTEHIEIEYESVPQKTEVLCLFIKIIAELGLRDHRLTYLVPSYLLNDNRINTLVQHNIPERQIHWYSAVNSTMLYLLENNLVNTLCVEESFLEALNSPLKDNASYLNSVEALIDSFLSQYGPSFFIRLRAETNFKSKS